MAGALLYPPALYALLLSLADPALAHGGQEITADSWAGVWGLTPEISDWFCEGGFRPGG